ncbi:MAG: hypothetical protein KBC17_01465 [Candidatus Pacebacteria bacterium]|nr:hypothetical protein [Candidatus Paceibacterota bacterium]
MNETEPEILMNAAADWWAGFFQNPVVEPGITDDRTSLGSLLGMYISVQSQMFTNITSEQIVKFKEGVVEHLKKYKTAKYATIGTDHAPEWPLSEILRNAGIPNTYFPSFTTLFVDFENGEVRYSKVHGTSAIVYPVQT